MVKKLKNFDNLNILKAEFSRKFLLKNKAKKNFFFQPKKVTELISLICEKFSNARI